MHVWVPHWWVCLAIILALQSWKLPQYMSNFQCLSFRFFRPGFTVDVARQLAGALSLIRLPWRPRYGPGGLGPCWEDKAQSTRQTF
uniref:Putative secreted protein n=1 Tax=Ixodes ricinus TaxID=34613 RepID=A0A147BE46_IXORI